MFYIVFLSFWHLITPLKTIIVDWREEKKIDIHCTLGRRNKKIRWGSFQRESRHEQHKWRYFLLIVSNQAWHSVTFDTRMKRFLQKLMIHTRLESWSSVTKFIDILSKYPLAKQTHLQSTREKDEGYDWKRKCGRFLSRLTFQSATITMNKSSRIDLICEMRH